jgi:hypothetical protein
MPKNPPQRPTKGTTADAAKSDQRTVEKERSQFKTLLLANPNYFGNLKDSPLKAEVSLQLNTGYEQIGCVGYQPQANRLEAVIFIRRPNGYGGDVCSAGTQEFVRFYISFDNGTTWDDLGLRSFTAYDIPGTTEEKRLEYAVTLPVQLRRKICIFRNQARVRAILSWNVPPPPNSPGFNPVWGDVHNTNIQIEPLRFVKLLDVITALQLEPLKFSAAVDLEQTVSAAKGKVLKAADLKELYKGKNVEPHRFAFNDVQTLLSKSSASEKLLDPGIAKILPDLGIDLSKIIDKLFPTDGNTNFEELDCIGLSPDENLLAGIIRLKLPNGYSGGPCTAGSKEYVTFWADTDDNGTFETCLGTTSVNVYDSDTLPEGGLEYAVFLPVDLDQYRKPCKEGPRLMRIRAILSWQQPPPCSNPNFIPVWGNREETIIHIKPGRRIEPGDKVPLLTAVGDIIVSKIDNTGLAQDAVAIHTGVAYDDAPFGGRITLAGKIVNGASSSKYRIMRKTHGAPDSAYVPLTNEPTGIGITVNTWDPVAGFVQTNLTIHADANGYYNYEDYASNHFVESNILSVWFSNSAEDNQAFDLRLDLKVDANPANDVHSNVVTVLVDNTGPVADLKLDLGVGGECADFNIGAVVTGKYTATDLHFGGFSFVIRPPGPSHGNRPVPPAGSRGLIAAPGLSLIPDPGITSGTFSLQTANMDPCGYSLTIVVSDRTNVNSGQGSHSNEDSVGFCLRRPPTP